MSAEKAQKLVQGGIKAVRDGNTDLARKAFTGALKLDPNNEAAWLGMATITEDVKGKLRILKKILEINPDNERAKEAVRRLAADQKKAEEPPPQPASSLFTADVDESAASVFSSSASDDDLGMPPMPGESQDDLGMPPMPGESLDDLGMPPLPGESLDDLGMPPLPGEIPAASSPAPSTGGLRSLRSLRDTSSQEAAAVEAEEEVVRIKTSAEAFAEAPKPAARGSGGTPYVDDARLDQISSEVFADVQTFLEEALADYLTPEYAWTKKKRGRAGDSEYAVFLLQAIAGTLVFVVVVGFGFWQFIQSSPAARGVLFGPTWTPSNTPTPLPTTTPGLTNTPSQTPSVQPTASPALSSIATPGNPDQYFPPEPTDIYYPRPLRGTTGLTEAVRLMDEGRMDEAFDLIIEERDAVASSGAFPPIYHLSEWYLRNGDLEMARQVIDDWDEEWRDSEERVYETSQTLVLTAYARVDIADARLAIEENRLVEAQDSLASAEDRLDQILGIGEGNFVRDAQNPLVYVLLAQRFELDGDIDTALSVLEDAIASPEANVYGSTQVRFEKARILAEADRYTEALQELSYVLYLDPFQEDALILQIQVALESGQAGLAVLFSQQYLLYYPGSVQGYWLLGQAREAENKLDLAINAYSRGLNGDWDNEEYTSDPYFLPMLIRRADIYVQQGRLDLASDDFTQALELTDNDPAIRAQRMEAAYASGDYAAVLEDADILLGSGELPQAEILFMQGRAYVDQGENYSAGLEALNSALNSGLSADLRPLAHEYVARASYELRSFTSALDAINLAIDAEDTGSRRYLRGLIYEGRGDYASALLDYEYVLTWGAVYPYPFLQDAQERYDDMIRRLGRR